MVKAGNKGTYKPTGAEIRKVSEMTFTKISPQVKIIHLHIDNIAARS